MSVPFNEKRRQMFLSQSYYENMEPYFSTSPTHYKDEANLPMGDTPEQQRSLAASSIADDLYDLLSLHYTAGEPLDDLRKELEDVVAAYEEYQKYLGAYEDAPQMAAFGFGMIDEYERCMQLIGLCYLLHRLDLLPRIAKLQDPGYKGEDTLYEDLLAYDLEGRSDVDQWYHDKPYRDLINSLYRDTPEESLADIKAYCDTWYPAMKSCPWHDGHTRMTDTDGDYFGYWAFEAGAVAFLLDIDDSTIEHMVYPKDLVAYARKLRDEGVASPRPDHGRLRAERNEIVPKTGWWHSIARPNGQTLHYFEAGQHFPDWQYTKTGEVIWDFDPNQQKAPPKK